MNTSKVGGSASKGKTTQSYRLYKLLADRKHANIRQIARTLKVEPLVASSYVAALRTVYGARIPYDYGTKEYTLLNKVNVPRAGIAGHHLKKLMAQKQAGNKSATRIRRKRTIVSTKHTVRNTKQAGARNN